MFFAKKSNLVNILKHIIKALFVLLLFGAVLFILYSRFLTGRESREFSGVVMDKWVGISETQQGSFLYPKILVKTDDGEQIKVGVDSETYEKLKISMRVKHDSKGTRIEQPIIDSQ